MTSRRLMDGAPGRPGNGPASPVAYAGPFVAGTLFKVTGHGQWVEGYWHWVPVGGDTVPRKFALWQLTAGQSVGQVVVPGSAVTSGALLANAWNYTPLPVPVGLSREVPYVVACGWTAVHGFAQTINQFGAGQPFASGISNAPLFAYSDQGASAPEPFTSNYAQGLFSAAGADPAVTFPNTGDTHSNFWVDVQVTDVPTAVASYELWPSQPYPNNWALDTANNFTISTEFVLSRPCSLNEISFYSPPGVSQLPTEAAVWDMNTLDMVPGTHLVNPVWSGPAGSGLVRVFYSGVTLPAGKYKVSVFNGAGVPQIWSAETSFYWGSSGLGNGGVTNGPLSAPSLAAADPPGQGTYHLGVPIHFPDTFSAPADGACYWVSLRVTPQPVYPPWASTAPAVMAALSALFMTIALDGEVRDGPSVGDAAAREVITVGYTGPDDDSAAENQMGESDLGGSASREQYQVRCAAAVLNGDELIPVARERAFALFSECGKRLAGNRNLGGACMKAEISSWELREDMSTGGAYSRVRFDVSIDAFTKR